MKLDDLPWETIQRELHDRAFASRGPTGAVFGAGMGVASALALRKKARNRTGAAEILAAAAIGLAYGAAHTERS